LEPEDYSSGRQISVSEMQMKTRVTVHRNRFAQALAAVAAAAIWSGGLSVARADTAQNFTIVNHATGQPLSLYDYQGSVIVLDFWAYWCFYCGEAASDIEPNVTEYYRNAGGNANGVPVQVISVSVDCSDQSAADAYIAQHGLELVADDCSETAYSPYSEGGIPQFAVINGTTNSLNFSAWEIIDTPLGYLTNYTVSQLKSDIDSVQTPAPVCTLTAPATGASVTPPSVNLAAVVASNGKIIQDVAFFNDNTLLGRVTNAPYNLTWSNVTTGAKSVCAVAYYGAGFSACSATNSFIVAEPLVQRLSLQGDNVVLSWTGGSGKYQVQVATNLYGASWANCGAAGSFTNLTLVRSNSMCFYRVVRE